MQQNNKKWVQIAVISAFAVLALLTISLIIWGFHTVIGLLRAVPGEPEISSVVEEPAEPELSVPTGDIFYYYGHTIPVTEGLDRNPYQGEDFAERDGILRYVGENSEKAVCGIDVSEFQGEIDWAAVKNSGIDFVMLRAGFRGYTAGIINGDETFLQNAEAAHEAGLKVGVYFFSQALNAQEGKEEADFVLNMLDGLSITYPVVFDWEPIEEDNSRTLAVNRSDVTSAAAAFCEEVKAAGYRPMIYLGEGLAYLTYHLSDLTEYDIWFAGYTSSPSFFYDMRMWQYTDQGRVDGISSAVDLNICFEDYGN